MDFDFNQEQYMFQETVRGFFADNFDAKRSDMPGAGCSALAELWGGLAELGLFAILVPEEQGGLGLSLVDLALLLEECGRSLAPAPIAETIVSTDIISRYGTSEQKNRFLPGIADGSVKLTVALSESNGFDPNDIQTFAIPSGNGWRLDGSKILVPCATEADYILIAVKFAEEGTLGSLLLEPARLGISNRRLSTLDLSSPYYETTFDDVSINRDDVVGGSPNSDTVYRMFDVSGSVAASLMTGIAGKVMEDSIDYAKQRVQFGKPIASFQAIKHKCADIAVAVDASRSAAYYAAWALAENSPDRAKAVSIAKSFCGETSRLACNEGIQIHGGIGFTWELGLHHYLRRSKALEAAHGDAAFHRERVIAATLAEIRNGAL